MNNLSQSKKLLLWILSFGLPWALVIFPGIYIFNQNITSWQNIWNILGEIIIPCSILGVLITPFQFLLFNDNRSFARVWAMVSLIAYSLAFPSGLALAALIPFLINPSLTFDGSTFMIPPVPMAMIFAGLLTGLLQLIALSKLENNFKFKVAWLLSSMLTWGVGFYVWIILANYAISERIASLLSGSFIGLGTGLAFIVLTGNHVFSNIGSPQKYKFSS